MKNVIIAVSLALALTAPLFAAGDVEQRTQNSRQAIKELATSLKAALQSAMKSGGPTEAISVCRAKAPQIASEISEAKGWRVARTSLKTRNPANAPDDWELKVLRQFEERKAAGEDPKKIDYSEIVQIDGRSEFRYMKAIPTQEICLVCHGAKIAEPIASKLEELYPLDRARGYSIGDIRGAFTVAQPM